MCCLGLSLLSTAATMPDRLTSLGQSTAWVRLLYLNDDSGMPAQPRITDDAFYFTEGPIIDPVAELTATYRAQFQSTSTVDDQHPICAFPSRYLWINDALGRESDIDLLERCDAFRHWSGLDQFDRVSLVMVDGYYGNPASSFGHLVVRLGSHDSSRTLLDTSINYGARIPEGDGPMTYIAKGLTGGYQASFTREDFYRQDLVYSRTEYRDMWNYELDLDADERLRLVAHFWELMGHPATYFFVKNNCAYAVAEALETVLDREMVSDRVPWYPPVTLFHELEQLEQSGEETLIRERTFIPSQKRRMAVLMRSLSEQEAATVQSYVSNPDQPLDTLLAGYSSSQATRILEALIDYTDFLIQGYPELGTPLYEQRRRLLMARLPYPAGRSLEAPVIEGGTPPGQTARTFRLELGAQSRADTESAIFGVYPYQTAPTDLGNPDLSELTLLAPQVRIDDEVALQNLTVIRVSQRSDRRQSIPGETPLSWTIDLGIDCWSDCVDREGVNLTVGLGQSLSMGPLLNSVMVYGEQDGGATLARMNLEVGLPEYRGWSLVTETGYEWQLTKSDRADWRWRGHARYSLNPMLSAALSTDYIEGAWSGRLSAFWHLR